MFDMQWIAKHIARPIDTLIDTTQRNVYPPSPNSSTSHVLFVVPSEPGVHFVTSSRAWGVLLDRCGAVGPG